MTNEREWSLAARCLLPVLLLLSAGCAAGVDTYGEMEADPEVVDIEALLGAPELYLGGEVRVIGQVTQVCQEMGCWFEVMQGGRRLMIDLQLGRRFTIPPGSAGRHAVVDGTFVREDGVLKVIGRGVELHDGLPG